MEEQGTGVDAIDAGHLKAASIYAATAYGTGLVTTAVLLWLTPESGVTVPAIGMTFYGAHNVAIGQGIVSINPLQILTNHHEVLKLLWTVPPLLLGTAGFAFASTPAGTLFGDDETAGAKAGALVAAGYLVLALAGTFVFSDGGIAPLMGETIVYMGIFYPVVFGAIGGYLSRYHSRRNTVLSRLER